ncbi:hypothetical protein D3C80_1965040 [compost metagenome]
MDFIGRKLACVTFSPTVRDQMHRITTRLQLMGQCLCRKHMTAGSPGGKQHNTFVHSHYSAGTAPTRKKLRS